MRIAAIIHAPWNGPQVDALNRFQRLGHVHPFTCGNEVGHPSDEPFSGDRALVATRRGWICCHCDYKQGWAYSSMLVAPPNPLEEMDAAWTVAVEEVNRRNQIELIRRQRGIIQGMKGINGVLRGALLAVQEWRVPYQDEGTNGVIEHFREVASVALEWEPPK